MTKPVTPDPADRFRWDRLSLAASLSYCLLVGALSVGVVLGELRDEFGLSGLIAALHGSTFGLALIGLGVFGVRIVERIGRRNALAGSAGLIASGVLLLCTGGIWPVTLAGTAASGTGAAMVVMVMPGVISDHHREHRAAAFSAVNGVPGLAGVGYALLVGAALGAGLSWRLPYLALTAAIGVALVVVARPVVVPSGERHGPFRARRLLRGEVFGPWTRVVLATVVDFSPGFWVVAYLREVGGASSGAAPLLASLHGLGIFAGRLAVPALLHRIGPSLLRRSYLLTAAGTVLLVAGPTLGVRSVGVALTGLGAGPLYPLSLDRFQGATSRVVDSVALGAYGALASGLGVTVGPLALGVLSDSVGLRRAMLVVPVMAVVGAVISGDPSRRRR